MSVPAAERAEKSPQQLAFLRATWDAVCKDVDPIIEDFASKVDGKISPWAEGMPGKVIRWDREESQYEVALIAARLRTNLLIAGKVSKDDVSSGLRHAVAVPGITLRVPVESGILQDGLKLYEGYLNTAALVLEGKTSLFRVYRYPIPPQG